MSWRSKQLLFWVPEEKAWKFMSKNFDSRSRMGAWNNNYDCFRNHGQASGCCAWYFPSGSWISGKKRCNNDESPSSLLFATAEMTHSWKLNEIHANSCRACEWTSAKRRWFGLINSNSCLIFHVVLAERYKTPLIALTLASQKAARRLHMERRGANVSERELVSAAHERKIAINSQSESGTQG